MHYAYRGSSNLLKDERYLDITPNSEMKRGSQPNIMDALYEFYICSLISQAVIESLQSVRQCANTPRTEKKASRHQQEGMCT